MSYTKTAWVDNTAPAVNAADLNNLETGVADAHLMEQADYFVYKTPGASTFEAKGRTLANVAANTDAGAVLQACMDNMNSSTSPRGLIVFAPNTTFTFTGGTIPLFRRTYASGGSDDYGWLRIIGAGNTVFQRTSATSANQRMLGFNKVADYDGFCGLEIANIRFDGNNCPATSDCVIGTATDAGPNGVVRCDIRRIYIHDCEVFNMTNGTAASGKVNGFVWLEINHSLAGEATQNQMTDVIVERCRIRGGSFGVVLVGGTVSGTILGLNVYGNRLRCSDIDYDSGLGGSSTLTTALAPSSGIQIGSGMFGDELIVERCRCVGSSDDLIETNNFKTQIIRDCICTANANAHYTCAQFNYTNGVDNTGAADQIILYDNCVAVLTNPGMATNLTNVGWNPFGAGNAGCDMGTITLRDCRTSCGSTPLPTGQVNGSSFQSQILNQNCERIILERCSFDSFFNCSTGTPQATAINLAQLPRELIIRDLDLTFRGAQTAGTYSVVPIVIHGTANGSTCHIDIDGLTIRDVTTGRVNFSTSLIYFGGSVANPLTCSATVRHMRILAMPAININVFEIGATNTLTLGRLTVKSCDFTAMTSSSRTLSFDTAGQNANAVFVHDVKSPVDPPAPAAMTGLVTATGKAISSVIAGYQCLVTFTPGSGTAITAIDISTNGGTNYTNYLTQASGTFPSGTPAPTIGPFPPDTLIKVTFTGTQPTINLIPVAY